jgi:chemotaxis protein CheD
LRPYWAEGSTTPMLRIRNISQYVDAETAFQDHDSEPRQSHARVYTGDVATSLRPVVLHTLLGSCVAVCVCDQLLGIGGMNHILLPGHDRESRSTRFGVHAMELLIHELIKQGADRRRLIAKAFGGANVMPGMRTAVIGDDNINFVREFLATARIPLVAQRLGGDQAVHVYFKTDTGQATVLSVNGLWLPQLIHAEDNYWRPHAADTHLNSESTLF